MKIITYPNEILSQISEPVVPGEIDELKSIFKNMVRIIRINRGLGLAAPQIGISKRFFVRIDSEGNEQIFINPSIIHSGGKIKTKEGCLSLPNIQKQIKRKRKILIRALDENGKRFKLRLENMDAVIVQHEIDHLNGITILDGAKERNKYVKNSKSHEMGL